MDVSEENARTLLSLSMQQRRHWSTIINTLMGLVGTINIAILGYLVVDYIDKAASRPASLVVATAISAVSVAIWRVYSRYLDNLIAYLYPEIFYYERKLTAPSDSGISGYLINNVKGIDKVLCNKLDDEHKR